MKKLLLSSILGISLFAGEIQFGKGSFSVDASFLGLKSSKSEDITSISLVGEHKNIFSTKYFYGYKIAYYKSNTLTTSADYIGNLLNKLTVPTTTSSTTTSDTSSVTTSSVTTSSLSLNNLLIYNKLRGIDLNIVIGRDFINKERGDTYFGVGILVGASFPYLKTSSNSNDNNTPEYLKKSKTKFYTYKVGLSIKGEKAFNEIVNGYFNTSYAFQTARVKNDVLGLDSSSDGNYLGFNVGIKFQAKTVKKIWKFTISPSIYATMGYRYDYWKVNDVKINSLNLNTDIKFKISQLYVGLGYDF